MSVLDELYPTLIQRIGRACPDIPAENFNKLGVKLKFEDFQVTTLDKSAVKFGRETFNDLLTHIWQRAEGRSVRLIGLHVQIPELRSDGQMSLW